MRFRKPTVGILGASGMLGSMVARYFHSKGYKLYLYSRPTHGHHQHMGFINDDVGDWAKKHDWRTVEISTNRIAGGIWGQAYIEGLNLSSWDATKLYKEPDFYINAVGIVKPAEKAIKRLVEVNDVNAYFPFWLAQNTDKKIIHVSTDCVYSGRVQQHPYDEAAPSDALDLYGQTKADADKRLWGFKNAMVLRTSIIGPEPYNKYSLLEWTKKQEGRQVKGYIRHHWNGITTLQWAKIAERIVRKAGRLFYGGEIRHIFSEPAITKYELLQKISDVYSLDLNITPYDDTEFCDRSLGTVHPEFIEQFNIPSIDSQLQELYQETSQ